MDVVRLNPTTFLPDTLVEGYTSMIWTERYSSPGEFELKTPQLSYTRDLIPEGSLISLRDSNEVMLVETHSMKRDTKGNPELVVKGRTFDSFLENRILLATVYKTPWPTLKPYTSTEFVALLIWMHMVNTTGEDPTRVAHTINSLTAVPQVVVTDSTTFVDASDIWSLEEGHFHKLIQETLGTIQFGLRSIRPYRTDASIMSFDTTRTAARGTVYRTNGEDIAQLRMDIYNGEDRTRYQDDREKVIFHYDSGHIDSPEYLISIKDYKNVLILNSSAGSGVLWSPTVDPTVSGLDRRFIFMDGGEVGDLDPAFFADLVTLKATIELEKHRKTTLFDGAVSMIAPYKYNRDYFLGDYVTLMGEFGFEASLLVSEYIRSEDANGEREYPGLSRGLDGAETRESFRRQPRKKITFANPDE